MWVFSNWTKSNNSSWKAKRMASDIAPDLYLAAVYGSGENRFPKAERGLVAVSWGIAFAHIKPAWARRSSAICGEPNPKKAA